MLEEAPVVRHLTSPPLEVVAVLRKSRLHTRFPHHISVEKETTFTYFIELDNKVKIYVVAPSRAVNHNIYVEFICRSL